MTNSRCFVPNFRCFAPNILPLSDLVFIRGRLPLIVHSIFFSIENATMTDIPFLTSHALQRRFAKWKLTFFPLGHPSSNPPSHIQNSAMRYDLQLILKIKTKKKMRQNVSRIVENEIPFWTWQNGNVSDACRSCVNYLCWRSLDGRSHRRKLYQKQQKTRNGIPAESFFHIKSVFVFVLRAICKCSVHNANIQFVDECIQTTNTLATHTDTIINWTRTNFSLRNSQRNAFLISQHLHVATGRD